MSTTIPATGRAAAELTIQRIETQAIRMPLAKVYRGSNYHMTHRSTVLCRVVTSDGLVGQAWAGDEDAGLEEIVAIVHDEIAPNLLGASAGDVERCWQLARPATTNILRDRRLGLVACACVDSAIWDAIGTALDCPLWRLWGGYRSSIPMISIGGYYGSEQTIAEEIAGLVELGVAGMKFKVGGRSPAEDAGRFIAAREAAPEGFVLMADANQGFSPREAIEFAQRVSDHDLRWFEEPCHWANDRLGMRDVRAVSGVQVCAGQSEMSAAGCRDLMVAGAIDVCNFDASWSGGPTEWRRVAGMATAFDVAMGHHEEPQVASHLLASIAHGTYVECFHPDRDPLWWRMVSNRPELVDGELRLPHRPGLGWELDEELAAHHTVDTRVTAA